MANEILLRTPALADAPFIAALSNELGYDVTPTAMSARIATLTEHPDHHLIVAVVSDEIAGWIQVHTYESLESGYHAEIVGLIVGVRFRRNGIGRLLTEEAINWSRRRHAEVLVVRSNVVRKESHHFYPSVGFELSKTQAVYRMRLCV